MVTYTRFSQQLMFRVLQVLDILKYGFAMFFNSSVHQKGPALSASNRRSIMVMAKIYVEAIDNFNLIVHYRRRLDVS